ncbi:MAG: TIGR00730 family Rossman fold protein [Bacteroidetes bacterium]|nr:TIGR00730 family Rossman fold protein [Bacteroidota bacterium]
MKIKSLTVFCGSKSGNNPLFIHQATALGKLLALNNIELVYGGGNKGLMGAVANGCIANGGKVTGIMPKLLLEWEAQHTGLTELIVTETMHERKLRLYEKGDAAMVLPGGLGTFDELFEMLVWNNLSIHDKKIVLFNYQGFYDPLLAMIDKMEEEDFLYERSRYRLHICTTLEEVMAFFS